MSTMWTPEEIAVLREHYQKPHGAAIVSSILVTRSESSVHQKAAKLCVKGHYLSPSPDMIKKGVAAVKNMTASDRNKRDRKAGDTMRGRPQRIDSVVGATVNHKNAKKWAFKNVAQGVVLEGKNLNQLIRDNSHLFSAEDLKQFKGSSIASICLRQLTVKRTKKSRPRGSWKGWTLKLPVVKANSSDSKPSPPENPA